MAAEHKDLLVWLTQIERFLQRENFLDAALGRARLDAASRAFEQKNRAVAEKRLSGLRSSEG